MLETNNQVEKKKMDGPGAEPCIVRFLHARALYRLFCNLSTKNMLLIKKI